MKKFITSVLLSLTIVGCSSMPTTPEAPPSNTVPTLEQAGYTKADLRDPLENLLPSIPDGVTEQEVHDRLMLWSQCVLVYEWALQQPSIKFDPNAVRDVHDKIAFNLALLFYAYGLNPANQEDQKFITYLISKQKRFMSAHMINRGMDVVQQTKELGRVGLLCEDNIVNTKQYIQEQKEQNQSKTNI